MAIDDDLEEMKLAPAAEPESRYYTPRMIADSIGKIDKEMQEFSLPEASKTFLSYIGAYALTMEPGIRDLTFTQSFSCRPVDRKLLAEIFELRNMGALAKSFGDSDTVAPERLKEIFSEIDDIEKNHLQSDSLIGGHYACILAAEQKYRPLLIMAADGSKKANQSTPHHNKYQYYFNDLISKKLILFVEANGITIPAVQLINTANRYGLPLEIIPEVNQEIKRIKLLYEQANQKFREAHTFNLDFPKFRDTGITKTFTRVKDKSLEELVKESMGERIDTKISPRNKYIVDGLYTPPTVFNPFSNNKKP